ncbi:Similar to TM7SF3: Transmembrane 7 superfamily member 3 (Homo sapiens) [Cotesia congregata]|uniref:Similar to TM7SF3: Transmembrane 7 superfamily member 3 (Homo sapiens) n=1 Tax=Cotesia congregata TaxID=51543 RepID=A0A8J2H3U0_COTCN|nr:Similar to TM7SF3: Transmembrane 7 superfamily member 3 (Homo sapiens) [Cotesia congregata]
MVSVMKGKRTSKREKGKWQMANDTFNTSQRNGQAFYIKTTLPSSKATLVLIKNSPSSLSFIIIQAHAQENLTLITKNAQKVSRIAGTNIGLQLDSKLIKDTQINVINDKNKTVPALIAITAYTFKAPVPGGCNMEFDIEVSPYQRLMLTNSTIIIDSQPASAPLINGLKLPCEKNLVTYEIYRLYTDESDFNNETYFSTIIKMLTVDDIIKNAVKIPTSASRSPMRKVYSSYPRTGSAYVMIATFGNHSSAYVPIFSYGCTPFSTEISCDYLKTAMSKVLCASVLFFGIFLTLITRRRYEVELFLLGCFSGGIIGYIILHDNQMEAEYGQLVLVNDTTFWIIYSTIVTAVVLLLCIFSPNSNIICCAFIGAFAIILPIDYWVGSSLKYIIINTVRRITVYGFNVAIIHPPFQSKDIWLSVFWILLALQSIHLQRKRLQGGSPLFPRRVDYNLIDSESSYPIISEEPHHQGTFLIGNNSTITTTKNYSTFFK